LILKAKKMKIILAISVKLGIMGYILKQRKTKLLKE